MFWLYFAAIAFLLFLVFYLYLKYRNTQRDYGQKYPNYYICKDGHKARSLSEVIVDNCLYRNGIDHEDEKVIKNNASKKYKYDWYLPQCDVYLEFFGYFGKKYHQTRKKKEKFYKKYRLTMIPIEPKDLQDIDKSLEKKLKKYWKAIISTSKSNQEQYEKISLFCPNCGKNIQR